MGRIMGWKKLGSDTWGNWTGEVYVEHLTNGKISCFQVIRKTNYGHDYAKNKGISDMVLIYEAVDLGRGKTFDTREEARAFAIQWMRNNPHYRKGISKREIAERESRLPRQEGSFRGM